MDQARDLEPYVKTQVLQLKQPSHVYQWILIEMMNQNLGGTIATEGKDREADIDLFVQVCDILIDILTLGKKKYQKVCFQIGMIERLWLSFGIHKIKVF